LQIVGYQRARAVYGTFSGLSEVEGTKHQGLQAGQRLVVENVLKVRFGELDEHLYTIISRLMELPVEEYTPLLVQLSRKELLTRFQG
jgi:dihydropteroate synthase